MTTSVCHYRRSKMTKTLTSSQIIDLLGLEPLPGEGGFFRRTYSSYERTDLSNYLPKNSETKHRHLASAIYYLLTKESFSTLHRLPSDEIFHFYLGDSVKMCLLSPSGSIKEILLGTNIQSGERPQVIVPANTWQGAKLVDGGDFALLGTTMTPSFEFEDLDLFDKKKTSLSEYSAKILSEYLK